VVAKVDRLTRSLGFLTRLIEAGADVRFCDLPQIEGPTGRFMLQQMAAVAELEAGMISMRTKAALAAAKARGMKLGGDRGGRAPDSARAAGTAALEARARDRAADLAPMIADLRKAGATSLRALAKDLSERGIETPRGGTEWTAVQVSRVLARLPTG
jgi:DNA invertase Pin-like site-specific DNA recombinase